MRDLEGPGDDLAAWRSTCSDWSNFQSIAHVNSVTAIDAIAAIDAPVWLPAKAAPPGLSAGRCDCDEILGDHAALASGRAR